MGGALEAAARGGMRTDELHLMPSQACNVGVKAKEPQAARVAGRGKTRTGARVEELPQEAREAIEGMLAGGTCRYQDIAQALSDAGFTVTKEAIGRHDAGKAAEERQDRLLTQQLDDLNRWMKKHQGFDMPGAALSLVIGKLCQRLAGEEGLFDKLPADKAATGLIQAARAADQHEKSAGDRKKLRAAARAEAVLELREALKREPEIWEQIEALVAKEK